jgi:hypothetical protein
MASHALDEILAQHDALRAMMDHCDQLADALDLSDDSPAALIQEIARLREAFEAHNRCEERELRPLLGTVSPPDDARLDRVVAHHVDEHRAMHRSLVAGPTAELRVAIAALRGHLAIEERYFQQFPRPVE